MVSDILMPNPFIEPMTKNHIRWIRKQLNLTQEEFASRLGVSFPTVSRWENGKTQPSSLAEKQLQEIQKEIIITDDLYVTHETCLYMVKYLNVYKTINIKYHLHHEMLNKFIHLSWGKITKTILAFANLSAYSLVCEPGSAI